ncbi:head decoration protein [Salinicola acroporae]|uniref:Head decoration protein n=1 Tax=Salinicola acroporae TaxID=1541440 RepID=A0ABT6I465_9GAMM|nr:head decoration protein [Salinicola acroporae]MDH4572464.1 head decoration protein [Salinicola acroporae]
MAMITEPRWTGEHVVSEANGQRSREQGILAAGKHAAGTVLAKNADGDFVALAPGANDATKTAAAILYAPTDASEGPVPCVVHARDCEVHDECLAWPDGITDAQKTTALKALDGAGIVVR